MAETWLQRIRYLRFNSAAIREILKLIYHDNSIYKIPFGPLRGFKLIYKPYINFHMMLGLWELENANLLKKIMGSDFFKGSIVAADVGANVGMLSLWLSKYLSEESSIYAFEPTKYVCEILKKNMNVNGVKNVQVIECACADSEGEIEFFEGSHHHTSSLIGSWAEAGVSGAARKVVVKAVTLDAFFKDIEAPDFIKMDIEGGGVYALKGAVKCFEKKRPLLFIESHTPDEDQSVSDLARTFDYELYRLETKDWIANLSAVHPVLNGVWGTMLACPVEKKEVVDRIINR